tara:strand:- start:593 stop:952 length:360 start_codon:yes stop_codon:yes gene_type:complete
MTSTARFQPEDFYDSDECRLTFCEWLSPDSGTDTVILAAAQAASFGIAPGHALDCTPEDFCEWLHNELAADDEGYEMLIDHLMECLQEEFQAERGYWDTATLWAYESMCDMASDWQGQR